MSQPKVGKLKFKGDSSSSRSVKRKPSEISEPRDIVNKSSSNSSSSAEEGAGEEANFEPISGTGRLTSSGNIIHGHFTKFMDELVPGDAVIIVHPTSLVEEMKVVRIVVSNTSMSISSAFSSDLVSTTPFKFIKAPKQVQENGDETEKALKARKKSSEDESNGTYASQGGSQFVYRVKKEGSFGGYKIVTEKTNSMTSREELLDKREKKKSDRFCY